MPGCISFYIILLDANIYSMASQGGGLSVHTRHVFVYPRAGEVGVVSAKPTRRRCTSREGALVAGVVALLLLIAVLIALVATFSDPCRHQRGPGCNPDLPEVSRDKYLYSYENRKRL